MGILNRVSIMFRAKVMGVRDEHAENLTVIIPVPSAQKLVDAKTDDNVFDARLI